MQTFLVPIIFGFMISQQALGLAGESKKLSDFFKNEWKYTMEEFPEWATSEGYPGQNHRWTDYSIEAIKKRYLHSKQSLSMLKTLNGKGLNKQELLHRNLYMFRLQQLIDGAEFSQELLALDQLSGFQVDVPRTISQSPKNTPQDLKNILKRLNSIPRLIGQTRALLELGIEKGIVPPRVTLKSVPDQLKKLTSASLETNPITKGLAKLPDSLSPEDKSKWTASFEQTLKKIIVPAVITFSEYFNKTYLPKSRSTYAIKALPKGQEWYKHLIRYHTTTELSAEDIHGVGLDQIQKLNREFKKVAETMKIKGPLKKLHSEMRTNKKYYFEKPESLLHEFRNIAKKADAALVTQFTKLPRLPYGVKALPEHIADSAPAAFYFSGSIEAARAGYFVANTSKLDSRPKWSMEALTLHEGVPGHHLQIAIADEQKGVPNIIKKLHFTAYTEGWGLYAESLGSEMGFYKTPESKYGEISLSMWRAIRLVVDTGLHHKGWSREQAIETFINNSGMAMHDIEAEVDRYIAWPGQALAYMIGAIKIRDLKNQAKSQLKGSQFDIRSFHDMILASGALPLPLLEKQVDQWVKQRQSML